MSLLDDPPFSLAHPDAVTLVERLNLLLPNKAQVINLANASEIKQADVDWDGPMAQVWPPLLEEAARKGKLRLLVTKVAEAVPDEPFFEALLEGTATIVPVGSVAPEDIWATARLWKTDALIDRADLRQNVRAMIDPDGQRALLVTGQTGMGKSHTRRFISYLAEKGQLPRVRVLDNSRRAGPPMTVQELAQLVASTVAGEDAPKFDLVAQPESIVTQFKGWLSNVSASFWDPVWIVFDGFTSETATAPALQLIHDLAASVAERELGPMRVAVLGFDGPAPIYAGIVCEPLRHPTPDEVKAFFKRMSVTLQGVESDAAAIDEVYERFVQKGGPIEDRPLAELGPSALKRALEVYGGATP